MVYNLCDAHRDRTIMLKDNFERREVGSDELYDIL